MNIGEQINNLRKQHGLSQDDFANLFNVSRQTISNWEIISKSLLMNY